jgi:hypothetical protein
MQPFVTPRLVNVARVRSNPGVAKANSANTQADRDSLGKRFLAALLAALSAPNA